MEDDFSEDVAAAPVAPAASTAQAAAPAPTAPRGAAAADKAARLAELDRQLEETRAQQARAQRARLRYLLGQSEVFRHFLEELGDDGESAGGAAAASSAGGGAGGAASSSRASAPKKTGGATGRRGGAGSGGAAAAGATDAGEAGEEDEERVATRLQRQPRCIVGEMRDYQLEGLNWMISLHENGINGILADEMGLGKTLQTISLLGWAQEALSMEGPHVVLVPKSTLANWEKEIKRFCPSLKAVVLHGDPTERAAIMETNRIRGGYTQAERGWNVLLTSYEVANIERGTLSRIPWQYLVIDEAHRIKNEDSTLSATVRSFITQHRLLITGTPLQNNLHELWALLNFLLPDVFGSSSKFDDWFNLAADTKDEEAKQATVKQLHRVLKPFMLRRLKADVAKSLPPKTETVLYVGMTEMQREVYKGVLSRDLDTVLADKASGADRTRLSNIIMHLRKACNHPYLFDGVEDRSLDPMGEHLISNCAKLALLDKLLKKLQEQGSRVLIFSQFTTMLDILEDYCRIRELQYCRIDGNTAYEDREDAIEAYNAPGSEKFVFLLSTRAGGLGINLATADVVVIYDSDWNPQADLQAQDRAHRIGQTKPVKVYRLVTEGSVEEKVVERAMMKLKLDAVVVQQGRLSDKQRGLSKDEMLEMVRFGANNIFRAGGAAAGGGKASADVTDADIDEILRIGEQKTKAMSESINAMVGGGLLDFKIDSTSAQVFEGVNYARKAAAESSKQMRVALVHQMAAQQGERSAKTNRAMTYNEEEVFRALQAQEGGGGGGAGASRLRQLLPPHHRPPARMTPYMLLNIQRIDQITAMQIAHIQAANAEAASSAGGGAGAPSSPGASTAADEFDPALVEERAQLVADGFPEWRRHHFLHYVGGAAKFGRAAAASIAAHMAAQGFERPVEEVARYGAALWARGERLLSAKEWGQAMKRITRGEQLLRDQHRMSGVALLRLGLHAAGMSASVCLPAGSHRGGYVSAQLGAAALGGSPAGMPTRWRVAPSGAVEGGAALSLAGQRSVAIVDHTVPSPSALLASVRDPAATGGYIGMADAAAARAIDAILRLVPKCPAPPAFMKGARPDAADGGIATAALTLLSQVPQPLGLQLSSGGAAAAGSSGGAAVASPARGGGASSAAAPVSARQVWPISAALLPDVTRAVPLTQSTTAHFASAATTALAAELRPDLANPFAETDAWLAAATARQALGLRVGSSSARTSLVRQQAEDMLLAAAEGGAVTVSSASAAGGGPDPAPLRAALLHSRRSTSRFNYYARSLEADGIEGRLKAVNRALDRDVNEVARRVWTDREKEAALKERAEAEAKLAARVLGGQEAIKAALAQAAKPKITAALSGGVASAAASPAPVKAAASGGKTAAAASGGAAAGAAKAPAAPAAAAAAAATSSGGAVAAPVAGEKKPRGPRTTCYPAELLPIVASAFANATPLVATDEVATKAVNAAMLAAKVPLNLRGTKTRQLMYACAMTGNVYEEVQGERVWKLLPQYADLPGLTAAQAQARFPDPDAFPRSKARKRTGAAHSDDEEGGEEEEGAAAAPAAKRIKLNDGSAVAGGGSSKPLAARPSVAAAAPPAVVMVPSMSPLTGAPQ